ncbi:MAG: SAM-dependent methyltransferase [Maribacter sp.]|nr:MAG: SAM-dependent methyltransferase [Maribacter sp.]
METDVFGKALLDYLKGDHDRDITTYSSLDEEDTIPVPYLFRGYKEMPKIEQKALDLCHGNILDIGCGAGSHSLYLQEKGLQVTALDQSVGAVACCNSRGVKNTVNSPILDYNGQKYDTLLLLMNGIGIVGRLKLLKTYLEHFKSLMLPNGQILLDSSDIIYMFEEDETEKNGDKTNNHEGMAADENDYYGEVDFTITYKGVSSNSFPWLYLDYTTLWHAALECHLNCELIKKGNHYDYLARLTFL